jgi:hypothetical protein
MTSDIEAVRAEILHAFRKVKRPKAKALFDPWYGKSYNIKNVKKALARKNFDEVSPIFLKEHWSPYNRLSAKAHRYYLQALLLNALDHLPEDDSFASSAVWHMAPHYSWLYYTGKDEQFDYQTSLFTNKQQYAVCSFMGLMFKTLHVSYQRVIAQALRSGWGHLNHPAIDECNAFYHNLHNFTYPPAKDAEIAGLITKISQGFADTPYPSDDGPEEITNPESDIRETLQRADGLFYEGSISCMAFKGLDWRTLHPQFLAYYYSALNWLSDEAFRYFLPAYLIETIHDAEIDIYEVCNAEPVWELTRHLHEEIWDEATWNEKIENIKNGTEIEQIHFTKKEWKAYLNRSPEEELAEVRIRIMKRFALFSQPEREAIIAYLQYRIRDSDKNDSHYIHTKAALDNYWLRTI